MISSRGAFLNGILGDLFLPGIFHCDPFLDSSPLSHYLLSLSLIKQWRPLKTDLKKPNWIPQLPFKQKPRTAIKPKKPTDDAECKSETKKVCIEETEASVANRRSGSNAEQSGGAPSTAKSSISSQSTGNEYNNEAEYNSEQWKPEIPFGNVSLILALLFGGWSLPIC